MSKFDNFNSDELQIIKDIFNQLHHLQLDTNISYIVESYIYAYVKEYYSPLDNDEKDKDNSVTIREYYSSEEVKLKYEYVVRFDKKHGKYTTWYENGNKDIECFYKDGKLEGEYKCWYKNGNKEVECFYKDDKLEGEYKNA